MALSESTVMTFRPSWDEFKNFPRYIEFIEQEGKHKAGAVKVRKRNIKQGLNRTSFVVFHDFSLDFFLNR